jgi:hypothetical protein
MPEGYGKAWKLILENNGWFNSHNLDVAKVSEVADPRRPGRSRINILRVLDNKGDAASQTFPKGKN